MEDQGLIVKTVTSFLSLFQDWTRQREKAHTGRVWFCYFFFNGTKLLCPQYPKGIRTAVESLWHIVGEGTADWTQHGRKASREKGSCLSSKEQCVDVTYSSLSRVRLFVNLWTIATLQTPLSMGFPRQEYWTGLPFPPAGDFPGPKDQTYVSCTVGGFFTTEPSGNFIF